MRNKELIVLNFKSPKRTVRIGPEYYGAKRLRQYMEVQGWYIKKLHGSKFQSGLPDLICFHPVYGIRLIETKAPGMKLRDSQRDEFLRITKAGGKIWVCEDEKHYGRLLKEPNWVDYI